MFIHNEIRSNQQAFLELCQKHQVKSLHAFGSSVKNEQISDASDIDLVVDVDDEDPIQKGELLMSLWDEFEQFFKRKVDLLTMSSIRNPILKSSIETTQVQIYDGSSEKIFV